MIKKDQLYISQIFYYIFLKTEAKTKIEPAKSLKFKNYIFLSMLSIIVDISF